MTGNPKIDELIELLCADGCREVRCYIRMLETNEEHPAFDSLTQQERELLLSELQAIMQVYGDECRL